METNASSKKALDESFSKKEVTFCDKSSILFYAAEEAVDSLNDSVIHTISNDNFPLLPEFSNMLQNSSIDSDSKYASDLGNLPTAIVVLEKLPEAILHKHTCSDSLTECYLMPNIPQNTDKVCSLKSGLSHHKKITEPLVGQISPILKKNKYQIRNLQVSIPQLPFKEIVSKTCSAVDTYSENSSGEAPKLNTISNNVKTRSRKASRNTSGRQLHQNLDSIQQSSSQNSFGKMPSSREAETSKILGKNCTEGKEIVDSDASTNIVSQVNGSEVSFDKYPCIHLEKLNLGPYLYDISSSSDYLKKDVPMDVELEVGSSTNTSGVSMTEKTLPVIEKVSPNTVKFSPPVIDLEDDSTSSDAIFPEENHRTSSILKDLLIGNEVSSNDDSVLSDPKNSPKDISFTQTKSIVKNTNLNSIVKNTNLNSIVKNTNLNNSIPYKNAQNKFPIVLLEKLNLPFSESDIIYDMDSTESLYIDSAPTVTNAPDLPIRIENVCSISTENFNTMHKSRKTSSNNSIDTIQKHYKKPSNQSFIDHFNENEHNIIKPKSNHVSLFNSSESSSERIIAENSSESSSESIIAGNYIYSSDDSSSENDLPLIMLSKQKLNLPLSFNLSEDSSSDDIPLISLDRNESLTSATQTKSSRSKSHKLKKKNSICDSSSSSSAMKKKGSKSQMPRDISKKKIKKKGNKFVERLPSEKKKGNKFVERLPSEKKKGNKFVERLPSEKKKSSKKSLKKKQMKVYKMITKYLEMQMKSQKHKKKSKKRKNPKSVNLVPSSNGSDTESTLSSDSVALMYDSVERDHSYAQNKNSLNKKDKTPVQRKKVCLGESCSTLQKMREHSYAQSKNSFQKRDKTSKKACYCGSTSTPKKDTKAKKRQKSVDKYRLGFLSNKLSLRFYNRFFASERLLFSKCKLKKNKKKELKRLFSRLKAVGLMSLK